VLFARDWKGKIQVGILERGGVGDGKDADKKRYATQQCAHLGGNNEGQETGPN